MKNKSFAVIIKGMRAVFTFLLSSLYQPTSNCPGSMTDSDSPMILIRRIVHDGGIDSMVGLKCTFRSFNQMNVACYLTVSIDFDFKLIVHCQTQMKNITDYHIHL